MLLDGEHTDVRRKYSFSKIRTPLCEPKHVRRRTLCQTLVFAFAGKGTSSKPKTHVNKPLVPRRSSCSQGAARRRKENHTSYGLHYMEVRLASDIERLAEESRNTPLLKVLRQHFLEASLAKIATGLNT
jgi:hypothetical protein